MKQTRLKFYLRLTSARGKCVLFHSAQFNYYQNLFWTRVLKLEEVMQVADILNLPNIVEDRLYDEINAINSFVAEHQSKEMCATDMWTLIFKCNPEFNQISQIVCKALSIPVSNAFVERVFSIMESVWRDDRNRMRVALVKAELCARVNIDMRCEEFLSFLKKDEQKSLLKEAKAQTKYNFKK